MAKLASLDVYEKQYEHLVDRLVDQTQAHVKTFTKNMTRHRGYLLQAKDVEELYDGFEGILGDISQKAESALPSVDESHKYSDFKKLYDNLKENKPKDLAEQDKIAQDLRKKNNMDLVNRVIHYLGELCNRLVPNNAIGHSLIQVTKVSHLRKQTEKIRRNVTTYRVDKETDSLLPNKRTNQRGGPGL